MPRQAKTTARGYGNAHKKLRRRWAREVALGGVLCARCKRPIIPGSPWDLDHSDDDPTGKTYLGPSHRRCNRRTRAHARARRIAAMLAVPRPTSRQW